MHPKLKCSVIVPTYNRERLLGLTLASLARQTLAADAFEVIVVDDGSRDNSQSVAEFYRARLNLQYVFQEDLGYRVAKARNEGIRRASSSVCVFLDSGVIAHSGCLAAHVESHSLAPSLAVCGYVYGFDQDQEPNSALQRQLDLGDSDGCMQRFHQQGRHLDLRESFYAKYGDDFGGLPAPWVVYWTCNVSARTEDLWQVGLFDEHFTSWGVEDVELAYRLFQRGARFLVNRRASAIHYPHERSRSASGSEVAPNYEYFARKSGDPVCEILPKYHFHEINDVLAAAAASSR